MADDSAVEEAAVLIREAVEQLSPPAYFGPGSWWERAHDWLADHTHAAETIGDAGVDGSDAVRSGNP